MDGTLKLNLKSAVSLPSRFHRVSIPFPLVDRFVDGFRPFPGVSGAFPAVFRFGNVSTRERRGGRELGSEPGTMASVSGALLFTSPISYGFESPTRFAAYGGRVVFQKLHGRRKTLRACIAPPSNVTQGFAALKLNGSLAAKDSNSDESDVLIECRDVYKSFGEKHILRGVSFKIRHGEAVGIIGPSGTGKSTVLKIMAGLLAPDKGEVYVRGKKRQGLISDEELSGLQIGLVFQSAALFDSLNVRENVGFLLYENSSMPEDQIAALVTETLAAVGLKGVEERLPSELSGGMKKRVALARSIVFDTSKDTVGPEVLLYDEPTAGLDPIASTVVEDLIRSVHVKGQDAVGKPGKIASYVVVTHQHSTIKRAVDRLIFLYDGKIVWEGHTDEFMTSTNSIVQQFASGSLDGPIKY